MIDLFLDPEHAVLFYAGDLDERRIVFRDSVLDAGLGLQLGHFEVFG